MSIPKRLFRIAALSVSALPAQAPAPDAAPRMVRVTVVARNAQGAPVNDLALSDLSLTDQDKPQRILYFRSNLAAPSGLAREPRSYSNHALAPPHTTVILFDLLNQNLPERLTVSKNLRRALSRIKPASAPYLYILTLDGMLAPVHPIGGKSGDIDTVMKIANRPPAATMNWEDVVKKTYFALETLAQEVATLPGPKDIVWITSGVPHIAIPKTTCAGDWTACALELPRLSTTLGEAGVAVNPLTYVSGANPGSTANTDFRAALRRDMELVAGLTGGAAFFGEDIALVTDQLTRRTVESYTLAYEPPAGSWDNRFHTIRIATRRAGMELHAQRQYYAATDPSSLAPVKTALQAAYRDPLDLPGIGLQVTVTQRTAQAVRFQILIRACDLLLREEADNFSARLTVSYADLGAHGPLSGPATSNFDLRLSPEQRDVMLQSGILIAPEHTLPEGVQKVRVFVQDRETGAVGSITVPLASASN